jgi:uncharacterized protein YukJ
MQIQAYLYANVVEVQIWDTSIFTPRNRVVYSRPITVYQGIDNPLQIVVKNQDQKSANLTGYTVQLDIQDPLTKGAVESLTITMTDITKGLGTVTIPKATVTALDQRKYKLSIKLIANATNDERPLYIDDNYGALLDLDVKPGWYEANPLNFSANAVIDVGTI